jgi:hypothetical protein
MLMPRRQTCCLAGVNKGNRWAKQAGLCLATHPFCNPFVGGIGTEVELQHPLAAPEGIACVTGVGECERSLQTKDYQS